MSNDRVLKTYKKRIKAQQRRIAIKHDENKKLVKLLTLCEIGLPKGALKDLVEQELEMLKYKYY